jgi:hypothetical protein
MASEAAVNRENDQVAGGVDDGLHSNVEPMDAGLILMLQPELRADFGRAQFEAELAGASANFLVGRRPLKAETSNRGDYKIDLGFLIRSLESR